MKKLTFLSVLMIISLVVFSQPKIIINDLTYHIDNPTPYPYLFLDDRGDFNDDGLPDMLVGQNNRSAIIFSSASNGLSAVPKTTLVYANSVDGVSLLKTMDSVPSVQTIFGDTLVTSINDSLGLKFTNYQQILPYRAVMIRNGEIMSQSPGYESIIVDSTYKQIHIYIFTGLENSLWQDIAVGDSISSLEFADFNQDGLQDLLVVCSPSTNNFAKAKIYCQNSGGTAISYWKEIILDRKQVKATRVADMFNDGFPDIIISSYNSLNPGISIFNFADTAMVPAISQINNCPYTEFAVGDFNYDGYQDIIALRFGVDSADVYRNNQFSQLVYNSTFYTMCGDVVPRYNSATRFHCFGPFNSTPGTYRSNKIDFFFCNGFCGHIRNENLTPFSPDLAISEMESSIVYHFGMNYQDTIRMKILNIGDTTAKCDSSLYVNLKITLNLPTGQTLWQKSLLQTFDSLSVGDSIIICFVLDSLNIPNNVILKFVGTVGQIEELTQKNNVIKDSSYFGIPDLTILEISSEVDSEEICENRIKVFSTNQGYGLAENVKIRTSLSFKRNGSIYFSQDFISLIPQLAPGDSACSSINLTEDMIGSLLIEKTDSMIVASFIDSELIIEESDETNNEKILRLRVSDFLDLDLSPNSAEFNFQIYPNPTSGIINLVLPEVNENVQILNSLGQRIWSQKVSGQTSIDLSKYPAGIYYLKINNLSKKIIKK